MTVNTTATRTIAIGNASATQFAFSFIGVAAGYIHVTYTDASGNQTLLNPTQYSIALNAAVPGAIWGVGGVVTYPLSGSPIALGTTLTIERVLPELQTVSLENQASYGQYAKSAEQALDLLTMILQQITDASNRAIVVNPANSVAPNPLPPAAQCANQLLGFDSTGYQPIVAQPSSALVSAAMQPVVAAPTIPDAVALLNLQTFPIGAEIDWSGIYAPSLWLFKYGQSVARATYPELFAVLCPLVTGTVTSGSNTMTAIPAVNGIPGTNGIAIGVPVEGNFPAGTVVTGVTTTTLTFSQNATGNASNVQVFPFGKVDTASFNLPDDRGNVGVGADAMGGTAANRVTNAGSGIHGEWIAQLGGAQNVTLTIPELPTVTPAGTIAMNPYTPAGGVNQNGGGSLYETGGAGLLIGTGVSVGGAVGQTWSFAGTPATLTGTFTGTPFGSGTAHPNMQPSRTVNKIIYAGH